MSSVGSSDNNSKRGDEVARRQRDEAKSNEVEMARKHKKELRRLTEQHLKEVERLKEQHHTQIKNFRNESNDTMSKRDHKYQQDIEKIRGMHSKAMREQIEEGARKEETLRDTLGVDNEREKLRNTDRHEKLSKVYQENLREKDQTMTEAIENAQDGQREGIASNRNRLNKAHKSEMEAMRMERDEAVMRLQNDLTKTREVSGDRIRDLEIQRMRQNERAGETLMHAVKNEREARVDSEQIMREGFENALDKTKDRYERAAKRERDAQNVSARNLKSSVGARIDRQVKRLELENVELKEANVRDRLKMKMDSEMEVDNIRDAWGKNVENLQSQKDQILHASNDRSSKDVTKIRNEMSKQMTSAERFYRERMAENNQVNRNAFNNLVGDFEARNEHTMKTADQRVKTIFDNSVEEKTRLNEMQKDTHAAMMAQHRDDMKVLRSTLENEKSEAINRLQDQFRKQEMNHADKMNIVTQKYEKQITALHDQINKERKLAEVNLKRTVEEMQRSRDNAIDQLELKNRDRMRQVTSQQQQELKAVNKRHEEKIDAVLTEVKKT